MSETESTEPRDSAVTEWQVAIISLLVLVTMGVDVGIIWAFVENLRDASSLPQVEQDGYTSKVVTRFLTQLALISALLALIGSITGLHRQNMGKYINIYASFFAAIGASVAWFCASVF